MFAAPVPGCGVTACRLQAPQDQGERTGRHEQQWGRHADDQVLHHVPGERRPSRQRTRRRRGHGDAPGCERPSQKPGPGISPAAQSPTLAAVAGITLAAASSLARDFGGRPVHATTRIVQDRGRLTLISLSFTVAASVLAPVLLYALFLPGHTATGARWTVYGTLPLIALLLTGSPAVSGTPIALFPDRDFHWFPLQTPGLITITAGFPLGLIERTRPDAAGRS